MKKLFLLFLLFFSYTTHAQDVHFSQILNSPLHINPANTGGYDGYERVVMNYRNQWSVLGAPYTTMGFSFDMPLFQGKHEEKGHLGVGVSFFSDKAGDANFGLTQGNLSLAGIVPMNQKSKIVAGIQAGYGQRSADISKLQWGSQYTGKEWDPEIESGEGNSLVSFGYLDLSTGVRWEYKNTTEDVKGWDVSRFSVGAAMFHVNQPRLKYLAGGDEKINQKLIVHFLGEIDIPNSIYSVIPFGAYITQGPLREITIGALGKMELKPGTKITGLLTQASVYAGVQLRVGDAIIPQVMYEFSNFGIGASFDYNISSLRKVSRGMGGFEITLKYHHKKGALFRNKSSYKQSV